MKHPELKKALETFKLQKARIIVQMNGFYSRFEMPAAYLNLEEEGTEALFFESRCDIESDISIDLTGYEEKAYTDNGILIKLQDGKGNTISIAFE